MLQIILLKNGHKEAQETQRKNSFTTKLGRARRKRFVFIRVNLWFKKLATKERKKRKEKLVMISADQWLKISHKEAQEAQRKNHFDPNHFAKKLMQISADQWLKT